MKKTITVKSLRYFETNRGVGYEAKTDKGSIWNDGNGGPTYFEANYPEYHNKDFSHLSETDLELLINKNEEGKRTKGLRIYTKS